MSSPCLRGKAKLQVPPHRKIRGFSKGRWARFAGGVPMENSRSLLLRQHQGTGYFQKLQDFLERVVEGRQSLQEGQC